MKDEVEYTNLHNRSQERLEKTNYLPVGGRKGGRLHGEVFNLTNYAKGHKVPFGANKRSGGALNHHSIKLHKNVSKEHILP